MFREGLWTAHTVEAERKEGRKGERGVPLGLNLLVFGELAQQVRRRGLVAENSALQRRFPTPEQSRLGASGRGVSAHRATNPASHTHTFRAPSGYQEPVCKA